MTPTTLPAIAADSVEPAARQIALRIAERIAKLHGYSLGAILGHGREDDLVVVRWAVWAEAAILFPMSSLPDLGSWFNRDHTAIRHALRRMGVFHRHHKPGPKPVDSVPCADRGHNRPGITALRPTFLRIV